MNLAQVKGFYTAKRTERASATTYATPKKTCTAQDIASAYTKNPQKIYESGELVLNRTYIPEAKVTLNTHTMSLADMMEMSFGLDAPEAGSGYEVGSDTDAAPAYAIGWPELLSDGTYLCTWYYKAYMSPPDESYKTANDQGYQLDPHAIEFSCVRDQHTGLLRRQQIVANAAAVDTFFAAVVPTSGI